MWSLENPPSAKNLEELAALRDPKHAEQVVSIFREHGDDVCLQWIDHVILAVKNHAVEVIGHLRARDGDAAIAAFNKDRTRFFALSATPIASDAWLITMDDGRSLVVVPDAEAAALMSPHVFERLFLNQHVGMTVQ